MIIPGANIGAAYTPNLPQPINLTETLRRLRRWTLANIGQAVLLDDEGYPQEYEYNAALSSLLAAGLFVEPSSLHWDKVASGWVIE